MGCSTELAATEWAPSYRRATLMQAPLAIIGFLAALMAWWLGSGPLWLVGGLLIFSVVPFTLLIIEPGINKAASGTWTGSGLGRDPWATGQMGPISCCPEHPCIGRGCRLHMAGSCGLTIHSSRRLFAARLVQVVN
jgi:Domain of unknown function (DUF1772)